MGLSPNLKEPPASTILGDPSSQPRREAGSGPLRGFSPPIPTPEGEMLRKAPTNLEPSRPLGWPWVLGDLLPLPLRTPLSAAVAPLDAAGAGETDG